MTKLLYGIPYVLSFGYHYDEFARVEKKWCQWILAKLFTPLAVRSADAVMVPTDFLRKYVERQGAKRAVVIPNGADTRRFAPDQGSKVKDQKAKSILFVGRFEPQKNLVELIRAVHLLQQTQVSRSKFRKTTRDRVPFFGKIVLTFVGQGSQKALLTRIAEKLGVSLHIVSPVSNEHLAHFYLRGGVFVLPSLVEGHPKALLEAMSCGLPVIASDIPGCRNIVTNQHDGLLVRPTVGGLQRGLEQLLNDQGFAAKLGRNARQTIVSKFDKKKLMEREMKVLHKTIGDR